MSVYERRLEPMPDEPLTTRRNARAKWPVRKYRLGAEPIDDLPGTTVAERVAMVWQLTCDAWASAGREMPDYSRDQMPVRILRGQQKPRTGD